MNGKSLVTVEGPRDLTADDVSKHIAVLRIAYRKSCIDFENTKLPHAVRNRAFQEMQRAIELIIAWKGVRADIIKSTEKEETQKAKLWL